MKTLLERCGDYYSQPFSLVAADCDDQPLVYVNDAFRNLVQYEDREVLGKNCRFLQGPLTDKTSIFKIRNAIRAREPICEDIINYRKDGTLFRNRLVLLPIQIKSEFFYFGMQHDVSEGMISGIANKSIKVDPHVVSDWIKNRLNAVILNLELHDLSSRKDLISKVVEGLDRISNYVRSLPNWSP